jgi:hypothetical protein
MAMARVFSAQLAVGECGPGDAVVWTVPAGEKAVALAAYFKNTAGFTGNLRMQLVPVGGTPLEFYRFAFLSAGGGSNWQGRVVLNGGDSLMVTIDATVTYIISGYRFLA